MSSFLMAPQHSGHSVPQTWPKATIQRKSENR